MEPTRFDALVQTLTRPGSRRRALGLVLAALAPATAAAKPAQAKCLANGKSCSQPTSALHAADRHKRKHHPPPCSKCCSGFGAAGTDGAVRCACKGEGVDCATDLQCCSGQCRGGNCTACPGNTVFCSDGCADLQTNDQHCGSCDNACPAGQRCVNGSCVCDATSCPTGCCAGTNCQRGTSDSACGTGGGECQTCDLGQRCDGETCVASCTANDGSCTQGSACCSGLCHAESQTCAACIPDGDNTCTHGSDCCVADVICCDGRCCPAGRTCCLGQSCCDGPCCPAGSARSCCNGLLCCPADSPSDCCPTTSQCCASDADCSGGRSCQLGCCR